VRLHEILEWASRLAGCASVPEDSQVYVEAKRDVRRALFGVDISLAEILWAERAGFDAVIAHHPLGDRASLDLARVVWRQVEQMTAEGIDEATARNAVASRLERPHQMIHMSNVNALVDTARLVGMPLCNIHLPCDIIGRAAIVDLLEGHRDRAEATVADAIVWLDEFPEIKLGLTRPETWLGEPGNRLGRWTVAIAGGINGGFPAFREYYAVGVDTIFTMHVAPDDLARLRGEARPGKNLVVTGHMATDSIGINRVIAGLEVQGVEVTRTSGVVAPG
jgi:putative NIF3 family GTP cyclohydrolase 1 type 2